MNLRIPIFATALATSLTAGHATTLDFPASAIVHMREIEELGSYARPTGPWQAGSITTTEAEGRIEQTVWQMPNSNLTTLQILEPLRQQLTDNGYIIDFQCRDRECGGFDFRFSTRVSNEPAMHVDLGDFRFLSAHMPIDDESTNDITLLISRSTGTGFVQITTVSPADSAPVEIIAATRDSESDDPAGTSGLALGEMLEIKGYFVLEDLEFGSGSSSLSDTEYASLSELAGYLNANPERTVALVGHTDAVGSLSGNVALSRRRAQSVVNQLIQNYDVSRSQLSAEGMGFLSPRASNLTDEGRMENRRVEVILTSTQQ